MSLDTDRAAIVARTDLNGMGHRYHDTGQFLDVVRRDGLLAARLFIAGGGLDIRALERGRELAASPAMKALLGSG